MFVYCNYVLQLVYQVSQDYLVYINLPILQYTNYVDQIYNAQHNITGLPNMQILHIHNSTYIAIHNSTNSTIHKSAFCKFCSSQYTILLYYNSQFCKFYNLQYTILHYTNIAIHNSQICNTQICITQFCNS